MTAQGSMHVGSYTRRVYAYKLHYTNSQTVCTQKKVKDPSIAYFSHILTKSIHNSTILDKYTLISIVQLALSSEPLTGVLSP